MLINNYSILYTTQQNVQHKKKYIRKLIFVSQDVSFVYSSRNSGPHSELQIAGFTRKVADMSPHTGTI